LRWLYGFLRNAWDYRKLFFNKKYGNLGMFVLPYSLIAVISVVILFLLLLGKLYSSILDFIIKVSVSGFSLSWPSFELFFMETDPILFIIFAIIILTIILMVISKKMVEEKKNIYNRHPALFISIWVYCSGLINSSFLKSYI
jgi:hypothetical protein